MKSVNETGYQWLIDLNNVLIQSFLSISMTMP